jgi:G3E family GTPase
VTVSTNENALVLSGFWPAAVDAVVTTLLVKIPDLRTVRYETPDLGSLHRTVTQLGRTHSCRISLTGDDPIDILVRDLATVCHHSTAATAVVTPPWCEPDHLRQAWRAHGVDGSPGLFVTTLAGEYLLDGLTNDDALKSVGLHRNQADDRSIGDLVARQTEQADAVIIAGVPDGDDPWEAEQLRTLVHRLAPWATHLQLEDEHPGKVTLGQRLGDVARTSAPVAPAVRGLQGLLLGVHEPGAPYGVSSCVFRARRPFHPGRLEAALDDVTGQVLRSRGHFWLASRPDLVLSWESTGTLTLGSACGWLSELPDQHWHEVDELRQVAASLDWDPYYGDRHSHLAFIGIDLDPVRIHRILQDCLLTDAELSEGEDTWRQLPDPFVRVYPALGTGRLR